MLLLGHRGARLAAPENTLEAFEMALSHGCDGFEFDVRCSGNGQAVICHDARLAGLTVARNSLLRLQGACPALATLDAVLERFAGRAYLYIELKVAGVEDAVLAALSAHPPQRGYVLASFLPRVLKALHARDASVPLGFIADNMLSIRRWRALPVQVVMPHARLASAKVIAELHAARKQVFVWTVNRSRQMTALAERGADAVLSDDTELLVRTLGNRQARIHQR